MRRHFSVILQTEILSTEPSDFLKQFSEVIKFSVIRNTVVKDISVCLTDTIHDA